MLTLHNRGVRAGIPHLLQWLIMSGTCSPCSLGPCSHCSLGQATLHIPGKLGSSLVLQLYTLHKLVLCQYVRPFLKFVIPPHPGFWKEVESKILVEDCIAKIAKLRGCFGIFLKRIPFICLLFVSCRTVILCCVQMLQGKHGNPNSITSWLSDHTPVRLAWNIVSNLI